MVLITFFQVAQVNIVIKVKSNVLPFMQRATVLVQLYIQSVQPSQIIITVQFMFYYNLSTHSKLHYRMHS